ncbi:MAG: elongation factor P [Patescibacteria group bacterium]|nr:elongation factor P [Patescibacteria group bacterium]MCL5261730.1 elongation factor P [Patescibacteria group bacterium]
MISYTDLKKGMIIRFNHEVFEVIDVAFMRMQQRKAVVTTRLKNLISGKVVERTWQASDAIEEIDIERMEAVFLYSHRGEYWFQEKGNPKNRLMLSEDVLGAAGQFLKPQTEVTAFILDGKPIKVQIPIKMELEVLEAPPSIKGNTAQGGNKMVTLQGGAKINAPLFINQGDVVRINTETGQYVERVEKTK